MSGMSTATILSLGLSAAGTAVGFAGQLQQQQTKQQAVAATAAQAVYQSQVARQNEEVMKRRADEALRQGRAAEENSRRLTNQRIGAQTARLAAQGTDLEGSPADILGDTAAAGEVDSLALRAKAAREACPPQYTIDHANFLPDGSSLKLDRCDESCCAVKDPTGMPLLGLFVQRRIRFGRRERVRSAA